MNWLTPTNDPEVFDYTAGDQADHTDGYEFSIDNSAIENFTTCSRAAYYYNIQRRELDATKSALFLGSVVHAALELRKARQLDPLNHIEWEQEQVDLIQAAYSANPQPIDEWRSADQAVRIIAAYNKKHPLADEPFTIIPGTVELGFKLPIGQCDMMCTMPTRNGPIFVKTINVYWTGRIDGLILFDGSIFVYDHKTTSIWSNAIVSDYDLSSQMHGYTWAARQLGHHAVGVCLDFLVTRKPTATGKAIEVPERERKWYTDEALDEWKEDTFTHITDFLEHAARNVWPKATKWCHGKYGQCPYWDVCTSPQDMRLPLLHSDQYKDVVWSPLADRDVTKPQTVL